MYHHEASDLSGDPQEVVRELHRLADAAMTDLESWPDVGQKPESIWQMLAQTGFTEEAGDGAVRYTARLTPIVELLLICVRNASLPATRWRRRLSIFRIFRNHR